MKQTGYAIICGIGILCVAGILQLYQVQITPRTSDAQSVQSNLDTCSLDFVKNQAFKISQASGTWSTFPCLEQINFKLDKLISLEESENK